MEINKEIDPLTILPPGKGLCPECAVKHDPTQPHDAQSLYYCFKFNLEKSRSCTHGAARSPTWADAMAHCSEEVKIAWIEQLTKLGIDINSVNKTGNIKTEIDLKEALDG